MLFQTGHLTITDTRTHLNRILYSLKIPNQEVAVALNDQFINGYTDLDNEKFTLLDRLHKVLSQGDLEGMTTVIQGLFAAIPWRNFTKNKLPEAEGYYASVLYAFFAGLNAEIIPEDITNHGQADMTVKIGGYLYVMEIKLHRGNADTDIGVETKINPALQQIQEHGYVEKYRDEPGKGVYEVGLVFNSKARNLVKADWVEMCNN